MVTAIVEGKRTRGCDTQISASNSAEALWEWEGGQLHAKIPLNRPLRVLLIGHQFQVRSEGQAKASALSCYPELEIRVLTPQRYKEGETHWRYPQCPLGTDYAFEVQQVRFPWAGPAKWYLQWYPNLPQTLCEFHPDIIDIWEEPWSLLSAEICWLKDRLLPESCLISETEQNINRILPPPFEWFRSYTFRKADFVIGRNSEAIQVARTKGFTGPARVVGNGVDTQIFHPLNRQHCREKLGVSGFAIGYAGRLVPEKGLQDLIQALDTLPEEVEIWCCGSGPFRETLEQAGPRVHVVDSMPRERLPEFYNAMDGMVLPSRTTAKWKEQFGRVVVEAQACEIPVVGSDSGAIPEVIGSAGMIFQERNPESLSKVLETIFRNSDLRVLLAKKGRQRAECLYSWSAIASQMRDVYGELARSRFS